MKLLREFTTPSGMRVGIPLVHVMGVEQKQQATVVHVAKGHSTQSFHLKERFEDVVKAIDQAWEEGSVSLLTAIVGGEHLSAFEARVAQNVEAAVLSGKLAELMDQRAESLRRTLLDDIIGELSGGDEKKPPGKKR